MTSRVAIGIRYLLPVYPFLYVLAGAFVAKVVLPRARRFGAVLVVAIVAIQTAESAAVYPNHLAFFNTLAGGPERGESYLLDSNLDWGQDLKRLKRYMDRTGTRSVCLHYFGSGLPAYYGIATEYLPATQEIPERSRVNCIAAISATILHGLYLPPGYDFNWLRGQKPIARVGRSIWIYDLRRK